jgi:cysteine-rich repeat protein
MKENKMKKLKKVIIPVMILCLIPACPDSMTWVTTDIISTSGSTRNPTDSIGESTGTSTTLVESSTTLTSTTETSGTESGVETGTSETDAIIPICGNSAVEFPEECDEGEAGTGTAFCTYNCTISFCGDGIVNIIDNEQCDDGNLNDLDACSSKCQILRQ